MTGWVCDDCRRSTSGHCWQHGTTGTIVGGTLHMACVQCEALRTEVARLTVERDDARAALIFPGPETEVARLTDERDTYQAELARLTALGDALAAAVEQFIAAGWTTTGFTGIVWKDLKAAARAWRAGQTVTCRCHATQTGVRCDLPAGHPGPHSGPDYTREDLLARRWYWT